LPKTTQEGGRFSWSFLQDDGRWSARKEKVQKVENLKRKEVGNMPVYDLEDAWEFMERDGKVKCADCIDDRTTEFDDRQDKLITGEDVGAGRLFVCDYCGKQF
jgi:hypothetical protein